MTRINVIPPKNLVRQHLIAEYRELPRVFKLAERWYERGCPNIENHPKAYTLGKGHVTFFYTRLEYLRKRFSEIVEEMLCRGYVVNFKFVPGVSVPSFMNQDWEPDETAINTNMKRIKQRLNTIYEEDFGYY
jgi:deoxyribonuclease (pyrimidine dimer)